ncbi:MAG: extracellular solute-binding protein [Clostridia bacterium]|nr:extracellular solute-binding protein [Clostridia bacterium]
MKRSRLFALIILLIFSFTLFAGCTDDLSSDGALFIALDKEDEGRYDELFSYYEQQTGVKITATYGQDVSKLIGTKQEPDIIKTSTVLSLAMKDNLLDLTSLINADDEIKTSDYIDSIMEALTVNGKIVALPTSINTSLLYYNKSLFDQNAAAIREALGLSDGQSVYPSADWTYDDYRKAGVALTKKEDGSYTQFGAETQTSWWGEWLVYVNQMGGSFYVVGSNNKVCALNSSEALAATQFFVSKSMGDATEKFAPNAAEALGGCSFVNGNVGMIFGGHMGDWYSYDKLGLNWDVQVLPTPTGRPDARGGEISADAFGISVRSKRVKAAFDFLKLWTGEKGALQMYKYGKVGALKNMRTLVAALPESERGSINISAVFDAVDKAVVLPREENFSKVARETVMAKLYRLLLPGSRGETDIVKVLNEIKSEVDEFYRNLG